MLQTKTINTQYHVAQHFFSFSKIKITVVCDVDMFDGVAETAEMSLRPLKLACYNFTKTYMKTVKKNVYWQFFSFLISFLHVNACIVNTWVGSRYASVITPNIAESSRNSNLYKNVTHEKIKTREQNVITFFVSIFGHVFTNFSFLDFCKVTWPEASVAPALKPILLMYLYVVARCPDEPYKKMLRT